MCFLLFVVVCISPFLSLIAAIFEKQSFSSLMETLYRRPSPPPSVKSPPMNERTTQKFSVSTLTLLRFTLNLPCFLYSRTNDKDDEQRSFSEEMKDKLIYIAQVCFKRF